MEKPKKKKFGILDVAKYIIFIAFAVWAFRYILNLTSKDELVSVFKTVPWWVYAGALIGTFLNWTLESLKWHKLINTIQYSSFSTSAKAVLSGTAVGNLLPYKIGEYLGKLYYVNKNKRALSVPLSFISSTIQLLVNLSICILPAIYIVGYKVLNQQNWKLSLVIVLVFCIALLLIFKHPKLRNWLLKIRNHFKLLTAKIIGQVTGLAVLRFLSFLLAYAWVIHNITDLAWVQTILGICAVYFMQSFAPGMLLTDGPVRIVLPLLVFKPMGVEPSILISASIINYLASVILPSLLGIVFILLRKR